MWLLNIVGSRIGRLVAYVSAAIAGVYMIFLAGKSSQRKDRRIDDLEDYKETRENIDEVKPAASRDDALDRLRDNDQVR